MGVKVSCPKCGKVKTIYDKRYKNFDCCNSRHKIIDNLIIPEQVESKDKIESQILTIEKRFVEEKPKEEPKTSMEDLSKIYKYQCSHCGAFFDELDINGCCPNTKCGAKLQ